MKLKEQVVIQKRQLSKTDEEKQSLRQSLEKETNHRHDLDSKLKQLKVRILLRIFSFIKIYLFQQEFDTVNAIRSQLQEKNIELDNEQIVEYYVHSTHFQ